VRANSEIATTETTRQMTITAIFNTTPPNGSSPTQHCFGLLLACSRVLRRCFLGRLY
jgi:hypothetical protein